MHNKEYNIITAKKKLINDQNYFVKETVVLKTSFLINNSYVGRML